MINQFYKVLELEPGASKSEVKKAYRRLAKRYHPDIHPGVGREKFLEISEAYNFLMEMMETGRMPSIDSGQNVSTPDRREYEEARQRAWAKAQKMANEKRRTHDLALAKVNKVFHVLAIAVLGLNLVYIADMLLPADNSRVDNVQGLIRAYTDGSFRYDLILNKMRIEVDELEHEAYDYGVIHVSPIFHKWTHATLYHEGVPEKVRFTMIAYSPLFIFLIILLILVYGVTLRLENQSSNKLSFFLIFFFAAAIQGMLVVFYV